MFNGSTIQCEILLKFAEINFLKEKQKKVEKGQSRKNYEKGLKCRCSDDLNRRSRQIFEFPFRGGRIDAVQKLQDNSMQKDKLLFLSCTQELFENHVNRNF